MLHATTQLPELAPGICVVHRHFLRLLTSLHPSSVCFDASTPHLAAARTRQQPLLLLCDAVCAIVTASAALVSPSPSPPPPPTARPRSLHVHAHVLLHPGPAPSRHEEATVGAARRRVPRRARGAPGRRPRRRRGRRSGRRRANARDPPPGGERARRRLRRRAVQEAAEQSWRRLRDAARRRCGRRRRRRRQAGRADRLQPPAQPMTRSCTIAEARTWRISVALALRASCSCVIPWRIGWRREGKCSGGELHGH
jgi:hypothetical protein